MNDTDALWDRVRDAFKAHQIPGIDRTPQMALGRLAAKCILLSFNGSNCTVREEYLSLDELQQLIRYHDNAHAKRDGGPIVVLVYEGQRFVIDGNKRVNKWLKGGDTELRSALILEPKVPAS
jgi:hypothetical protein